MYTVLYGCVCVCPWRLALQKEGWRQQMDEIRAVMTVEQLLFALSWSQKWKRGRNIARRRKGFQNGGPVSRHQGVAYTVSHPLRAVSSGDSGTFSLFSWQWAWQSLIQVSHWGTTIKNAFFILDSVASDAGCCMKPAKTIGDSQKNDTFFDCASLRVLWCGHSVCLGRVVFSRLDPLHHEWVCPCGGLTLHDFTFL